MIGTHKENNSLPCSGFRIHQILCVVLRNEQVNWPSSGVAAFFQTFLEQARYHGVEAMVCRLLKSTSMWEEIPGQVQDELVQALRYQAVLEMVRRQDLLALLRKFQDVGIFVLLLKGGALSYTHYPDPYLRSRCDTDIFISPDAITRVHDIFQDLGYQCRGPKYKSHQFTYSKKTTGGIVVTYDVHWRVSNVSKYAHILSFEKGMKYSIPIPALDNCLTLYPEQALMLACLHRAANPDHDPDRLIWLYDIHLLVSGMPESRMLQFSRNAVKESMQSVCLDAIGKSRDCFATQVPDCIYEILLAPSGKYSIGQRFEDSYLGLIIDDLRCLPDTGTRLALLRELLVPSAEELLRKYNKHNVFWIPVLYGRYLLQGLLKRFFFR